MEVQFRLTRRDHPARTDALFLSSGPAADLVSVCAALGGWPDVFRVAGGFVVVPPAAIAHPVPRTVRLRRLAGDLFLPADADLLPALRPDEAVGLTRERGLLILPGGTALGFDPVGRLAEADVLAVGPVRRGGWKPFPPRPEWADRLTAIRSDTPPAVVVAILNAGRPDDASPLGEGSGVPEDARPPSGSLGERVSAGLKLGAGQLLNMLGRALGAKKWAEAGANLARRAIQQVPRLSEKVLGEQEAALRELLRQLQTGDAERALRRAPIAVADPNAPPGRIDGGTRLSDHDARYSLRSLLTSGGGGGAAWLGGGDVWSLLAAEYRRLAEEAVRKGDYRRAAYLYGVLLRDPRQAAWVLDAGGLHRDAAVLYRDKLNDPASAAACFERAGCWDEAVELYVGLDQFEKAADLYRLIGDEAAALAMYIRASTALVGRGEYVRAGDLIRDKLGDADSGAVAYRTGWETPGPHVLGCGLRLIDHHLPAGAWAELRALVGEAEEKFAPPRADDAGKFFGHVAAAANGPVPEAVRDDLRDRARLALADHLRHHARTSRQPGSAVSTLFGSQSAWPGPVVRDAREGLRRALAPDPAAPPAPTAFRVLSGPITAAVVARQTGDLILANAAGAVVLYRGGEGGTVPVAGNSPSPPAALATDGSARQVVVLDTAGGLAYLESFTARPGGGYNTRGRLAVGQFPDGLPYLQPEIEADGESVTRLLGPDADRAYLGRALLPLRTDPYDDPEGGFVPTLTAAANPGRWSWVGRVVGLAVDDPRVFPSAPLPWRPAARAGSAFSFPPLDWARPRAQVLELAGVADTDAAYWSEVSRDGTMLAAATATRTTPAGYRVACLIGPGLVAAVTGDNQVHWLRADGSPVLRPWGTPRKLAHPAAAVFVAHRPQGNEVVVVFADGWAVRVAKP